jgi:hypothetical protein
MSGVDSVLCVTSGQRISIMFLMYSFGKFDFEGFYEF